MMLDLTLNRKLLRRQAGAMKRRKHFDQNTIAIVYDFDGTLTPQPMQEYTVLPKLGVSPKIFWEDVKKEAIETQGDEMLTYMRLLLERIEEKHQHLGHADLSALGKRIRYFNGVSGWFPRLTKYVRQRGKGRVKLKHYVISSGLREILHGTKIRRFFKRIYASEYFFNHHGVATFPKIAINATGKTQYLFRINKGRERQDESVNEYMPESDSQVPFENIVYIGDGMTDVPCMTVTKKNGGHAIAVYRPRTPGSRRVCQQLLDAKRIDYFAPADFRQGRDLEKRLRLILDMVIAKVLRDRDEFRFMAHMRQSRRRHKK